MNDAIQADVARFYVFRQNNSGGFFTGPAIHVVIEAFNDENARDIAQDHDVYFYGVQSGHDCQCCGDRWSDSYGPEDLDFDPLDKDNYSCYRYDPLPLYIVVYLDGSVKGEI